MRPEDAFFALDGPYRAAALLLHSMPAGEAQRLAGTLWREHRMTLVACIEGEHKKLRPSAISLLSSLVTSSAVVARELLLELERGGTRIDRGLRDAETGGGAPHQLASLGLALLCTEERSVLIRLLGGEHRRLVSAPLRLLGRLTPSRQLHTLDSIRTRVLLASGLPLRAKLAPCLSTLESVAMLYSSGGAVADAAHAHLVLVCTALVPELADTPQPASLVSAATGRSTATGNRGSAGVGNPGQSGASGSSSGRVESGRSGAVEAVLRLLFTLKPAQDERHQRLLLAALHALPSIRPAYARLRTGSSATMEPRPTRQWLCHLAFACRLAQVTLEGTDAGLLSHPPADSTAASAVLDAIFPGAFSRPFWSKALLHSSILVRVSAANALVCILPPLRDLLMKLRAAGAMAKSPHDLLVGSSAMLLAAELQRRLPDVQVLFNARSSAGSGGGGQLSHLFEARLLEALRLYADLLPTVAADATGHVEKLARSDEWVLSPLSRFHVLSLLRKRATQANTRPYRAAIGEAGAHATAPRIVADAVVLPPLVDLVAMLRLGISPQHPALRPPLWQQIAHYLERCGALHLAHESESAAWLCAVTDDSAANALASLLHACVASLHIFVDRSSKLCGVTTLECVLGQSEASLLESPALPSRIGDVHLSPLAICALDQLPALASSDSDDSVGTVQFLCNALSAIASSHTSLAQLIHKVMVQSVCSNSSPAKDPPNKARKLNSAASSKQIGTSNGRGWEVCADLLSLAASAASEGSYRPIDREVSSRTRDAVDASADPSRPSDISIVVLWLHALDATGGDMKDVSQRLTRDKALLNQCDKWLGDPESRAVSMHAPYCRSLLLLLTAWYRTHVTAAALHPSALQAQEVIGRAWIEPLAKLCATSSSRHDDRSTSFVQHDGVANTSELKPWRMVAAELLVAFVAVWPPSPPEALRLFTSLREAASDRIECGKQKSTSSSEYVHAISATIALCALLCECSDVASSEHLELVIKASLSVLHVSSNDTDFNILRKSVCRLLALDAVKLVFDAGPETLLYQVRDFMRAASSSATLKVASMLLEAGAGKAMRSLLPQLQRQILSESFLLARLRRSPMSRTDELNAAVHAQLHLLEGLAKLCPFALTPETLCQLLQSSTCAPVQIRRRIYSLLASHISGGMPIASFDASHAADFASHALHISTAFAGPHRSSCDAVPAGEEAAKCEPSLLMMHEVVSLQWLRSEDLTSLAERFPVDLLQQTECSLDVDEMSTTESWDGDNSLTKPGDRSTSACDALGVLLCLHCFLRTAQVDARQWVERGGVGMCVMAMAAHSESVRSMAYDCLARFIDALQTGRSFAERRQVMRLLLSLRDAITSPTAQIPYITAAWVAHGLRVMLRPAHPQYRALNAFVVGRPWLPLDEVPMFFDAFHGGGPRAREERIWLLQLIGRSLRTDADLSMLRRRHALQLVMSLHDSQLADQPTRRACVAVLVAAGRLADGAKLLVHDFGLPGWIVSNRDRYRWYRWSARGTGDVADSVAAAVAPLAVLLTMASADGSSLTPSQIMLLLQAIDVVWKEGAADNASASSAVSALAATCATVLISLFQLPQLGASITWSSLGVDLMHSLLQYTGNELQYHQNSKHAAGRGTHSKPWHLQLLSAMSTWTHVPRTQGDCIAACNLIHVATATLLGDFDVSRTSHPPLVMRANAIQGLVAWVASCCTNSLSFRQVLSRDVQLLSRLHRIVEGWCGISSLQELATWLTSSSTAETIRKSVRTLNECVAVLTENADT